MLAGAGRPPAGAAVAGVKCSGQSAAMAQFSSPGVYFFIRKELLSKQYLQL